MPAKIGLLMEKTRRVAQLRSMPLSLVGAKKSSLPAARIRDPSFPGREILSVKQQDLTRPTNLLQQQRLMHRSLKIQIPVTHNGSTRLNLTNPRTVH